MGVDIFFVISGYLISKIILNGLDDGTFCFAEFYWRRIRRIFPALLVMLTLCCAVGWFTLTADEYRELGSHVFAGSMFASNLVLWGEAGYFDSAADVKPLLHLWSLAVEEQFYIVWPFFLWLGYKKKAWLLFVMALIGGGSFFINMAEIRIDPVAAFYLPQDRFWELLAGAIVAWLHLYTNTGLAGATITRNFILRTIPRGMRLTADAFYVESTLPGRRSIAGIWVLAHRQANGFSRHVGVAASIRYSANHFLRL